MTFTTDQIKRLANILDNAGQVVFASIVIPFLLGSFDFDFIQVLIWLLVMILPWWLSLRLERISS